MVVPGATPVITPLEAPIVAIDGLLLLHVPPVDMPPVTVESTSVRGTPTQDAYGIGVMIANAALDVTMPIAQIDSSFFIIL